MLKFIILEHNINFSLVKTMFLDESHEKMDAGMHVIIRKKFPNHLINSCNFIQSLPASPLRN